jgi:hypothetical protein
MKDLNTSSANPKLLLVASLCILAALLQSPARGEMYKWKDAAGEIHYTQVPPPGGIKTEKIQGAPPPADDPDKIIEDLQKQVDAMDETVTRQEGEAREQSLRKEIDEAYEKNCIASRNNLAKLQEGGKKRYLTADGQVVHLSEEERQQRINEAKDQIDKFCKTGE